MCWREPGLWVPCQGDMAQIRFGQGERYDVIICALRDGMLANDGGPKPVPDRVHGRDRAVDLQPGCSGQP